MKPVLITSLLGIICLCPVYTTTIDITLANYHPYGRNIYKKFYEISEDRNEIFISNIHDQVGFLIVQVHSFLENVTLSNTTTLALNSSVSGKNIGLIWSGDANTAIFYLLRKSKIKSKVQIMIAISIYDETAPVPGGCNLSFNTPLAPYQLISYNYEYITVKSQAPSAYGISCDDNKVEIEMYHLFLNEHDDSNATYFDGIQKMLGVDEIKMYGHRVYKDSGYFKYNRLFSNYRGIASVYAIIATYNNKSSAYVPAVSYGCDETDWEMDCIGPVTDQWKIIISFLFLFGTFICFCGHKFFRFTLVMVGFTFGVFITYCIVSTENASSLEATMTSVCMGFFYGIFWAFIWWKYGVPILSVHLAILLSGCLLASNVFYTGLADYDAFTFNWNYWLTFLCIVVAFLITWIPATMHAHIFACSYLGSYACVTALNYYIGGNLQYIMINTYRRISVKHFNFAVINPPFQFSDGLNCILWILLMIGGFNFQLREQKQRPPFPPNRRLLVVNRNVTERTPLIRPEFVAPPEYV